MSFQSRFNEFCNATAGSPGTFGYCMQNARDNVREQTCCMAICYASIMWLCDTVSSWF